MNRTDLIIHDYNGHCIYQRKSDHYVDLTGMCRIFHKRYPDWKRLHATNAYLEKVAGSLQIPVDLVVITTLQGRNEERGSWGHKLAAISLARWLDPSFELWCNQHLLELMDKGTVSIQKEELAELEVETATKLSIPPSVYANHLHSLGAILDEDLDLAVHLFYSFAQKLSESRK